MPDWVIMGFQGWVVWLCIKGLFAIRRRNQLKLSKEYEIDVNLITEKSIETITYGPFSNIYIYEYEGNVFEGVQKIDKNAIRLMTNLCILDEGFHIMWEQVREIIESARKNKGKN